MKSILEQFTRWWNRFGGCCHMADAEAVWLAGYRAGRRASRKGR